MDKRSTEGFQGREAIVHDDVKAFLNAGQPTGCTAPTLRPDVNHGLRNKAEHHLIRCR